MSLTFKDVDKKKMALMGELYGKMCGYLPTYLDGFFMFVTAETYMAYSDGLDKDMSHAEDILFTASWSEGESVETAVADAFIDYVHSIDPNTDPEASEQSIMSNIMEYIMACESVFSAVLSELKPDNKIIVPKNSKKIVVPG